MAPATVAYLVLIHRVQSLAQVRKQLRHTQGEVSTTIDRGQNYALACIGYPKRITHNLRMPPDKQVTISTSSDSLRVLAIGVVF